MAWEPNKKGSIPLRITIIYAIVVVLWILLSDLLVDALARDASMLTRLQTVKDFLFVFVTASVLYLLISRDVTAIQRSERALVKSEAKYRSLVETINDWVWEIDENLIYTYSNPKMRDVLGYEPEEIVGKTPFDFMPEEEAKRMTKVFGEIKAERKPFKLLENTSLRKDGPLIILEINGTPIFDDQGIFRGYRGIGRDITERKRAEAALREKDREIRGAYVDVFRYVTGERIILMTNEEIIASLGEPVTGVNSVSSVEEIAISREILEEIIKQQFPNMEDADEYIRAANEALSNAVLHAGGGKFQVFRKGEIAQISVSDSGPGIDFKTLPKATLLAGFSTKASLGIGFNIMLELCDRVLISTQPGSTTVVLEKRHVRIG